MRIVMHRFFLTVVSIVIVCVMSSTPSSSLAATTQGRFQAPPIVYTIAGSDSGGGAGIQADLHAIHSMECHGCSAITCLTAQNSCGVSAVHFPPADFLKSQLDALATDLPPRAIKIGMLGTTELAITVGSFLKEMAKASKPYVVLDPVMISTSGHKLIDDEAKAAMIEHVFPMCDVLTPNKYEAEALLERKLLTPEDVEQGARDILAMGAKAVLIKGGHTLAESESSDNAAVSPDVNATLGFAQDYFLTSEQPDGEERLCDGHNGVWLRTKRYDSEHTHGTGCTLSSAMASALALGHQSRELASDGSTYEGATSAIHPIDACCLAKAYVAAGIGRGVRLGKGPGPVVQTEFPSSSQHYPLVAIDPTSEPNAFLRMKAHSAKDCGDKCPVLGRILPIVDTSEWVERLCSVPGVTDIQLRIKDETDPQRILERVQSCQNMCQNAGIRLWINDHWEAAVKAGCFGVHVGQEDLVKCIKAGGLEEMQKHNIALGISTHSYGELSAALAVKPTYISMGPVFGTSSKKVAFDPQGLAIVSKWRQLIPSDIPFVAIGGIGDPETAKLVKEAGADNVAVIGAVTQVDDIVDAVAKLNEAME